MGNIFGYPRVDLRNQIEELFDEWIMTPHIGNALTIAKELMVFVITRNGYRVSALVSQILQL